VPLLVPVCSTCAAFDPELTDEGCCILVGEGEGEGLGAGMTLGLKGLKGLKSEAVDDIVKGEG